MPTTEVLNVLDLFSGLGGLGDAFVSALGAGWRIGAYCEFDTFCQGVLISRMARGEIDRAPIWDDIRTLRSSDLPRIDAICGGWPCQGNSNAGLRKGMDDKRSALVIEVIRLVRELRPRVVFLENVPGVLTAPGDGVGFVLDELAGLGYDCRYTMLSAEEVGATHRRLRFWLMAHTNSDGHVRLREERRGPHQRELRDDAAGQSRSLADTYVAGLEVGRRQPGHTGKECEATQRDSPELAHSHGRRRQDRELQVEPAEARIDALSDPASVGAEDGHGGGGHDLPARPPRPNELEAWREVLVHHPEVEPAVRGMAARISHRNDRLRTLGNSVDRVCAEVAAKILLHGEA